MDARKIFVENLNKLMISHGKTQSDIVADLNILQSTFSHWMNARAYPRAEAINLLADYFDVPVSALVGENKGGSPGVVRINVYSKITSRDDNDMHNVVGFIDVPSKMVKQGELIALRVKGDYMSPKIDNDDTVIILRQDHADNGDIVVIAVGDDDAMIRKAIVNEYGMTLVCINSNYEPMFFSKSDIKVLSVTVIGKVIESRRKF